MATPLPLETFRVIGLGAGDRLKPGRELKPTTD
jgi:hypothetical protein